MQVFLDNWSQAIHLKVHYATLNKNKKTCSVVHTGWHMGGIRKFPLSLKTLNKVNKKVKNFTKFCVKFMNFLTVLSPVLSPYLSYWQWQSKPFIRHHRHHQHHHRQWVTQYESCPRTKDGTLGARAILAKQQKKCILTPKDLFYADN